MSFLDFPPGGQREVSKDSPQRQIEACIFPTLVFRNSPVKLCNNNQNKNQNTLAWFHQPDKHYSQVILQNFNADIILAFINYSTSLSRNRQFQTKNFWPFFLSPGGLNWQQNLWLKGSILHFLMINSSFPLCSSTWKYPLF